MVVGGIILAVISFIYRYSMNKVPPIQFLFTEFFFILIFNYYVLRDADIPPSVSEEVDGSTKLACFIGFLSLMSTCYAFEFIPIESVLSIFFFAFIFGVLIDILTGTANYSMKSCLWCLATLLGVLFILRPPFVFGDWGESTRIGHWGKLGEDITEVGVQMFSKRWLQADGNLSLDSGNFTGFDEGNFSGVVEENLTLDGVNETDVYEEVIGEINGN